MAIKSCYTTATRQEPDSRGSRMSYSRKENSLERNTTALSLAKPPPCKGHIRKDTVKILQQPMNTPRAKGFSIHEGGNGREPAVTVTHARTHARMHARTPARTHACIRLTMPHLARWSVRRQPFTSSPTAESRRGGRPRQDRHSGHIHTHKWTNGQIDSRKL